MVGKIRIESLITERPDMPKPTKPVKNWNGPTYADCKDKSFDAVVMSAQWRAFDKVLHWINDQDKKMISKGDLYDAVMEMRPEE